MLPKLITIQRMNSDFFKEEFINQDAHLVCLATNRLTLFNVFTGDTLLTTEQGNKICRTSNFERRSVIYT